jgi:Skp family chaperone for outer membrane proteins
MMTFMRTMMPTLFLLAVLLMPGLTAQAQTQAQPKIATVDLRKLLDNYYKTKLANADLEQRKADLTKEGKDMANELDKAQADYKKLETQAADPAISDQERDRLKQAASDLSKEINAKKADYDQFLRQAPGLYQDQLQRMTQKLLGEIQTAVSNKAKIAGYSLVLNSTSDAVVYSKGDNDLTPEVLAQLNAGAPIDLTPATGTNPPSPLLVPPALPGNP